MPISSSFKFVLAFLEKKKWIASIPLVIVIMEGKVKDEGLGGPAIAQH